MNVLLVDDEAAIRKMMRLMLQSRGFRVFESDNGAGAMALAREHKIDVLVTDVVMRDMDGWTLARSLVESLPDLPVLFVSGYPTDFESARKQYARCAFLPKPFQKTDLINAITDVSGVMAQ